jgi:hypothetical protein
MRLGCKPRSPLHPTRQTNDLRPAQRHSRQCRQPDGGSRSLRTQPLDSRPARLNVQRPRSTGRPSGTDISADNRPRGEYAWKVQNPPTGPAAPIQCRQPDGGGRSPRASSLWTHGPHNSGACQNSLCGTSMQRREISAGLAGRVPAPILFLQSGHGSNCAARNYKVPAATGPTNPLRDLSRLWTQAMSGQRLRLGGSGKDNQGGGVLTKEKQTMLPRA